MGGAGGDGPKEPVSFTTQVLAFCAFAIGNVGLNYFNSWALHQTEGNAPPGIGKGGFAFPFFYTMFHMLASAMAALILQCTCAPPKDGTLPSFGQLWAYKAQLFPIAIFTVLNTAFNNWSLVLVALFVNQVIKACQPATTSIFEFLVLGKVHPWMIYLAVTCLCAGSAISQMGSPGGSSSTMGIVVCLISLCAASAKGVVQKMIMSGTKDLKPLEPTQAMVWDCGISFIIMFFVWVFSTERDASIAYLKGQTGNPNSGLLALGIISFGSFLAFGFNLANYYYIHYTSALTMTIGSNGVKIFLLIISLLTGGGAVTTETLIGISIVILSIVAYAYLGQALKKPPAKTADEAPKETTPLAKP